jgi:hypothetical protein
MIWRAAVPGDLPDAARGGETKVAYLQPPRTVFPPVSTPEVSFSESPAVIKQKHDLILHQQGHQTKKQKEQTDKERNQNHEKSKPSQVCASRNRLDVLRAGRPGQLPGHGRRLTGRLFHR